METVADRVTYLVENDKKEDLHELLRASKDIFTKNLYSSKDLTYSKLKNLSRDKSIAVVPGDKDSSVVILNKSDYLDKMQSMLDEGIENGTYVVSRDTIIPDLKNFNSFIYRHFKNAFIYGRLTSSSS